MLSIVHTYCLWYTELLKYCIYGFGVFESQLTLKLHGIKTLNGGSEKI